MTLLTAHKILISTAIALFLIYAVVELARYFSTGVFWTLGRSALSAAVSAGLVVYFRSLKPF